MIKTARTRNVAQNQINPPTVLPLASTGPDDMLWRRGENPFKDSYSQRRFGIRAKLKLVFVAHGVFKSVFSTINIFGNLYGFLSLELF